MKSSTLQNLNDEKVYICIVKKSMSVEQMES